MSEIANNAKITLIWRASIGLCSVLGTLGVGSIFGYVKSADSKLSRIDSDVNQIKWELPVIKTTIVSDKADTERKIEMLDTKIEKLRSNGDSQSREISDLRTQQTLLKHKLQIP